MLGRGRRQPRGFAPLVQIIGNAVKLALLQRGVDMQPEILRPAIRRRVGAERLQVVHDVAAAHNQHALFAQRAQAFGLFKVFRAAERYVQTERHNGDIGVGKRGFQHRPHAVV